MAMSDRTRRRFDDAFDLMEGRPTNWQDAYPHAKVVVERLTDDALVDSVPLGAPTEGGGVLISATRLYHELEAMYEAGHLAAITEIAEGS